MNRSLKNKAFVFLILFGILPLLISGIIINILTSKLLVQKMNYMAEQTIDKLSLLVSKDLQGFIDITIYSSQNKDLNNLINKKLYNDLQKQEVFFGIRNQLFSKILIRRSDYPYHYILITKYGYIFTNFSYINENDSELLSDKLSKNYWYNLLSYSRTQKILITSEINYLSPRFEPQLYICSNIVHEMEPIGILLIGIDKYYISKLLENVRMSEQSSIYILNKNECLVEGEDNFIPFYKLPSDIIDKLYNSQTTLLDYRINGEKEFVTFKDLYIGGVEDNWKIMIITPAKDIIKDVNYINYIIIGMLLLSFLAVVFLTFLINKQIINPVLRLNDFAREVKEGNLDVRITSARQDEIGKLTLVFNRMVENIKQYIANIKEQEIIKRQFEISVLQSQINPHFIRNTLNIVRWMSEMMGITSISKAIVSIVGLINYNYDITSSTVSVRKEIKYLEEYIYLQKLRFQNKFTSKIEIDDEILDCRILKLVLQPIVENAIIHGFGKKIGLGKLLIKGQKLDSKLVFVISDDGIGMTKDKIKKILQAEKALSESISIHKIGLANVQQRIKLNYGNDYGIDIKSEVNIGTEVTIMIPYILKDEQY